MPLLTPTPQGLYCPAGDFHIDPHRRVPRALISHGHSDHAYPGHAHYLASNAALPVLRHRLGRITAEGVAYNSQLTINGVTVSFHPAGHVPGSAQIRVEHRGEVWVVSGDYKTDPDGLSEPFAPIPCHTFITECTFGLPIFQWRPDPEILTEIALWWAANAANGKISVLAAYSFGKAQRLITGIPPQGPIFTHPAVEAVTQILRTQGYPIPKTTCAPPDQIPPNALVIAPPNTLTGDWSLTLPPHATAFASGWMALSARRKGLQAAFTLSDHADFPGLNQATRATGATHILTTHGYTAPYANWLQSQGHNAAELHS